MTEYTEIKHLQQKPLYPVGQITSPVLCAVLDQNVDRCNIPVDSAHIGKLVIKSQIWKTTALLTVTLLFIISYFRDSKYLYVPPIFKGWPILDEPLTLHEDPRKLLEYGYRRFGKNAFKIIRH